MRTIAFTASLVPVADRTAHFARWRSSACSLTLVVALSSCISEPDPDRWAFTTATFEAACSAPEALHDGEAVRWMSTSTPLSHELTDVWVRSLTTHDDSSMTLVSEHTDMPTRSWLNPGPSTRTVLEFTPVVGQTYRIEFEDASARFVDVDPSNCQLRGVPEVAGVPLRWRLLWR